jgi:LacI family transcriptional regulator
MNLTTYDFTGFIQEYIPQITDKNMSFATNGGRVAVIVSGQTLERLTGGLAQLVGPGRDFWAIDIREDSARILRQLREWQPAGVIMEFREELTELVSGMGYPTVVVLADMLMEGIGCVNVDDYRIGQLAADYLREKGLRNFGFYGLELLHAPERRTGFLDTLEQVSVLEVGEQRDRHTVAQRRLADWLVALPKPAGIFAAHDPLAREVLEACVRLGLQVPAQVAVLSASNDPFTCELVYPGISSVEIPWDQVGLQAGRLLERLLAGERPGEPVVVAPAGIRTRGSTDFYRVSDERIQKAIEFMRAQLGEEIGIEAVVRAAGMDRRALERLFRAQLNRSPKQILTDMRTDRARELLEQSDLRIGEIAGQCGFGPGEKLAAAFRKRFGKTPREWRRG